MADTFDDLAKVKIIMAFLVRSTDGRQIHSRCVVAYIMTCIRESSGISVATGGGGKWGYCPTLKMPPYHLPDSRKSGNKVFDKVFG